MCILTKENNPSSLPESPNEPTYDNYGNGITEAWNSSYVSTNNTQFHNSFLPQTTRDVKVKMNKL